MKAGYYNGLKNVIDKIKLTRYQSVKHCLSYAEYQEFMKT